MYSTQLPGLYLLNVDTKERAVFTSTDIPVGSVIEVCPVILLNSLDTEAIHKTTLHDYYFIWDIETKTSAIALGYGSLYNHSDKANAEFLLDKANAEIKIMALTEIQAGSEITIDYIALKESGYKLWF